MNMMIPILYFDKWASFARTHLMKTQVALDAMRRKEHLSFTSQDH